MDLHAVLLSAARHLFSKNFREGMRRAAIVLGAIAGVAAATLPWLGFTGRDPLSFVAGSAALGALAFAVVWGVVRVLTWMGLGFSSAREGMRRTAIVLGACGCVAGIYGGYTFTVREWYRWDEWREYQNFLAASRNPTFQRASAPEWIARYSVPDAWRLCDKVCPQWSQLDDLRAEREHPTDHATFSSEQIYDSLSREDELKEEIRSHPNECSCTHRSAADKGEVHWSLSEGTLDLDSFKPVPSADGIAEIRYHWGNVSSIESTSGEVFDAEPRPSPDYVQMLLPRLLAPVVGFFVPWGLVRAFSWVLLGFSSSWTKLEPDD